MTSPLKFAITLVLLAFPLVEIALLIKAGSAFGFWPVFLWVCATALLGANVIRRHGLAAFSKVFEPPDAKGRGLDPIADTFLAVTGGLFLVFPGLLSDAIGAVLLVPHVRSALIQSGLVRLLSGGLIGVRVEGMRSGAEWREERVARQRNDGLIIEGEYERIDDDAQRPREARNGRGR